MPLDRGMRVLRERGGVAMVLSMDVPCWWLEEWCDAGWEGGMCCFAGRETEETYTMTYLHVIKQGTPFEAVCDGETRGPDDLSC